MYLQVIKLYADSVNVDVFDFQYVLASYFEPLSLRSYMLTDARRWTYATDIYP